MLEASFQQLTQLTCSVPKLSLLRWVMVRRGEGPAERIDIEDEASLGGLVLPANDHIKWDPSNGPLQWHADKLGRRRPKCHLIIERPEFIRVKLSAPVGFEFTTLSFALRGVSYVDDTPETNDANLRLTFAQS